jgi:hypothetical protein
VVEYYLRLLAFEGRTGFVEPVTLRKKNAIEGLKTTNINTIINYNRKLFENLGSVSGKPIPKAVLSREMKG